MNWIKNSALILATFILCYVMLVCADWIIGRIVSGFFISKPSESAEIISSREIDDKAFREQARAEGYNPLIYPEVMESTWFMQQKMRNLKIGVIGGRPNSKTYACNEGYGLVKYTSDRFGLRNSDKKWSTQVDTLFIGDSFVFGSCVDSKYTLPNQFEKLSNRITLNLGMGSNNPQHYHSVGKLFIPRIKPKNVYLVFYANDKGNFNSISNELLTKDSYPFFSKTELALSVDYKNNLEHISEFFLSFNKVKAESFKEKLLASIKYRVALPSIRSLITRRLSANRIDDSEKTIISIKELCVTQKCALRVVYIPNSQFWHPDELSDRYRLKLQKLASKLDLDFIDTSSILNRTKSSRDYAIQGAHLSPLGYTKVAQFIFQKEQL